MRFGSAFVALFLVSSCASGPRSDAPAPAASYIAAARLDATTFLGPAPDPAGETQRADLAAVEAAQSLKGQARWALAQRDDDITPYAAFGDVLGPGFVKAKTPRTAALFDILFADVKSLTGPAKEHFARPRPPLVDPHLQTCMPLEQTRSYPSGHAARGWLMALVLSEMAPEQANAILARGRDYGDSRVVCAEHFPSDVQAGRLIAAAIFAAAKGNPAFDRDFAAAKRETRAALGLKP